MQKKRLLARISGVKKKCTRDNAFLSQLESSLIQQNETTRDHEAPLWKQKSRDNWV